MRKEENFVNELTSEEFEALARINLIISEFLMDRVDFRCFVMSNPDLGSLEDFQYDVNIIKEKLWQDAFLQCYFAL